MIPRDGEAHLRISGGGDEVVCVDIDIVPVLAGAEIDDARLDALEELVHRACLVRQTGGRQDVTPLVEQLVGVLRGLEHDGGPGHEHGTHNTQQQRHAEGLAD